MKLAVSSEKLEQEIGIFVYIALSAAKEIPMYIHCKKEEKGTSKNADNYVYKIKQEKRRTK